MKFDIWKLLLVFDVVHIPLGQYIFLPNSFYRSVASILLNDPSIQFLASQGVLSVTHHQAMRSLAIGQYIEDYKRFKWDLAEPLTADELKIISEFPCGFEFDNVQAGHNAKDFLIRRISECQSIFGDSYSMLRQSIDRSVHENANIFIAEDLISRLSKQAMPAQSRTNVLHLLHDAYYVEPNHLATNVDGQGDIIFFAYDSKMSPSSLTLPISSKTPVRYFLCPEFIGKLMTNWLSDQDIAAYFSLDPAILIAIRSDFRWNDFVEYYHGTLILHLSADARRAFLSHSLGRSGVNFVADEIAGAVADHLGEISDAVSAVSGVVKFGGLIPLVLRHKGVRNIVENWSRSEMREFVKQLRYLLRLHHSHR